MMPERAHVHSSAQGHGALHAPDRSCCELTGQCDIKIAVSAPAVDPPAFAATLSLVVPVPERPATVRMARPAELAHGPPLYLRHATLLI